MIAGLVSGVLVVGAVAASAGEAIAAPSWQFALGQAPTGLTTGGQLALDEGRSAFFITNNTYPVDTERGISFPDARPRVGVFSTRAQRPVRTIDLSGQPDGTAKVGPLRVPMAQIPDGIALDTVHSRVVTTNAHTDSISVFGMDARSVGPANLIRVPGGHPMGAATDNAGRAWVSLYSQDKIAVIDTAARRIVSTISSFHPTLVAYDAARHRLYVGNNDYYGKKRNFLTVVDTTTNTVVKRIPMTQNARPAVDPSTGRIYTASFISGRVAVVDPSTLTVTRSVSTGSTPSSIVVDAQRRLVYATTLKKKTLIVLHADTLAPVATMRIPSEVHTLAIDPRTGWVYGTQNGTSAMLVVRPGQGGTGRP
ncbi:hypothetical protein nbrc107697_12990 [Gordonia crocea]|uniref:YncE family protein n=2 Tax=Gordonia crocea TaxID=589162 RepID=A0A7I9UWV4_9ACTN|nr:hypothetical protein nbrc107697_12990 [Gordonia crocea]